MNIGFNEDLYIEFKSDRKKLPDEEIVEAVVSFANTEGGDLYLGVEDDGEVTGIHPEHANTIGLAAFIANKTVPPISVFTEQQEFGEKVIKITVPRSSSIVSTSSGKILKRRLKANGEPENTPLYPHEISSRLSSLRLLDYSAQPVPESSIDDLDSVERERIRNIIRDYRGEQSLLELSDLEFDKALQFVTTVNGELMPTFTGLLMIGKQNRIKELMPTAESSIQILDGTDVKINESFFMPIAASFEKISDYFNAWNHEEELEIGLFRVAIPKIDKRAFREALVNAFCHRDYSRLGRVLVKLDNDGLTITNPGGFIEGISINNLLYAEPQGRNPVLANALKRIGLAERTGRGIDRIFEGSLVAGKLLPDYSGSTDSFVKLFIADSIPDKAFVKMLSEEQKKTGKAMPINALMVLNYLKAMNKATIQEMENDIFTDPGKVRTSVESLVNKELLEAKGTGRGRYYMLSKKVYKRIDDTVGYVRHSGIDTIKHEELILKLLNEQGYVKRSDVAELFQVTTSQAYRILQKMCDAGKIELTGSGKVARYIKNTLDN